MPQFKARPMPISAPFVPKIADLPLTEPSPFGLHTEERGAASVQRLKEQLEDELRREEEARSFRARPMPLYDEPWVCREISGKVRLISLGEYELFFDNIYKFN